jgi:hypothetical protein
MGQRPWFADFFRRGPSEGQDHLRVLDGGPLGLDSSLLVRLSGRAGKGIS